MYHDENVFDAFTGIQFRYLRKQAGLTQEEVAKVIHVSYQQLQKYEHGHNRFPLGKLLVALRFLKYPVHQFMEILLEQVEGIRPSTCIISIPQEEYATLFEVAKGVEQLAEKVRNMIKKEI